MFKIKPPDYKFCPLCGTELILKKDVDKKDRKNCPKCGWVYYPHVGSSSNAVIINNGKVLMVKRGREPYKDTWMFPAGFANFGEHPEETLEREAKEEANINIKDIKLIEILQSTDDPRLPGHFTFFYKAKPVGSIKNLDRKENKSIGWFSIDNPPKIGWKGHKLIMKKLQNGKI